MTGEEKTIAKELWANIQYMKDRDQRFLRILERKFLANSQFKLADSFSDRLYGIKRRYDEGRS